MVAQTIILPEATTHTASSLEFSGLTSALSAGLTSASGTQLTGLTLNASTLTFTTSGGELSQRLADAGTLTVQFRLEQQGGESADHYLGFWLDGQDSASPYALTLDAAQAAVAAEILDFVSDASFRASSSNVLLFFDDGVTAVASSTYKNTSGQTFREWDGFPVASISREWFITGTVFNELQSLRLNRNGTVRLETLSSSGIRLSLVPRFGLRIEATWGDYDLSLDLLGIGATGVSTGSGSLITTTYQWRPPNHAEVTAFVERNLTSRPDDGTTFFTFDRLTLPLRSLAGVGSAAPAAVAARTAKIPPTIHTARASIAAGQTAAAATSDKIEPDRLTVSAAIGSAAHAATSARTAKVAPTIHAARASIAAGQTAASARSTNISARIPASASIAAGPSAVAAPTAKIKLVRAAIASKGSALGARARIVEPSVHTGRAATASRSTALGARSRLVEPNRLPTPAGVASGRPTATAVRTRRWHSTPCGIGVSPASATATSLKQTPATRRVAAGTASSAVAAGATTLKRTPTVPLAPQNLSVFGIEQTAAIIAWDPPPGDGNSNLEPLLGYDIQFFGETWVDTASIDSVYRLTSLGSTSIAAGTSYRVRVRGRNSVGAGAPSEPIAFTSGAVEFPSAPRFVSLAAAGRSAVLGSWQAPRTLGGGVLARYETALIYDDGTVEPFDSAAGTESRLQIRGLADGHRYGLRVRAINQAGAGPPSDIAFATPGPTIALPIGAGQRIPLLQDVLRQSVVVRLDDVDCRISVWWQPWDESWYGSVEVPVNTPRSRSRRLAANANLLDRTSTPSPLSVRIVCRTLDADDNRQEPGRDAWGRTHALFIE